jgi:hypothetical protein
MEEAQFGLSPDLLKKVLVFTLERVGDACVCVRQQEDQLQQPDQQRKDRLVLARWT